MNVEEYISSGILESYVLGDLSEQERKEVEKNVTMYPRLREELLKIEEAQEKLLMQAAIQPRADVKKKLMAKINQEKLEDNIIAIQPINRWRYLAAASLALALVSSYLAYNYWNKWRDVQTSFNDLIAQNQQIAEDYNQVNQRLNKIEDDIQVIDNPAFRRIILKGTTNAPEALAYVYWNESTHEVYLSIQNMKALSESNQYQLWAIVDGNPIDAGLFDYDPTGLIPMKTAINASAFAVTVEPRGGKTSPTLETMQVLGTV